MFKIRCGIQDAYILDITMYKMHVSFVHSYINNVSVWDPTAHFKHC